MPGLLKANFSKSCVPCWGNPENPTQSEKAGCAAAQKRYFRRTFASPKPVASARRSLKQTVR